MCADKSKETNMQTQRTQVLPQGELSVSWANLTESLPTVKVGSEGQGQVLGEVRFLQVVGPVEHTQQFGFHPAGMRSLRGVLSSRMTSSDLHFKTMTKTLDKIVHCAASAVIERGSPYRGLCSNGVNQQHCRKKQTCLADIRKAAQSFISANTVDRVI